MAHFLECPARRPIPGRLIFLAGPIQGSIDWQNGPVKDYLMHALRDHDTTIANPRRSRWTELTPEGYLEQVAWEHDHLRKANEFGNVALFWLANPTKLTPEQIQKVVTTKFPPRPYAQTTRFELGEQVAIQYLTGTNLVVGIDDKFPNGRYIRQTISMKAPTVPILGNLEDTCAAAVEMVLRP